MRLALVTILVLAASGAARAQAPASSPAVPAPFARPDPGGPAEGRPKDPSLALWLSLGATLLPVIEGTVILAAPRTDVVRWKWAPYGFALAGLGLVVGPSVGRLYAGEIGYGALYSAARLVGFGGAATCFTFAWVSLSTEGPQNSAKPLLAFGAILGAASLALAAWDIVTAPRAARRANERRQRRKLLVVPLVAPAAARSAVGATALATF